MKKIIVLLIAALFLPLSVAATQSFTATQEPSTTEKISIEIETLDFTSHELLLKEVSATEVKAIEKNIMEGRIQQAMDTLGIRFDFGFFNCIISYGKGDVYVPLSRDKSLLSLEKSFIFRFVLQPIYFNYYAGGMTFVKFGANYFWKGHSAGDYGFMLGDQCGMMMGFFGTHIRIPWKLRPDTHLFVGRSLLIVGYDKFL